jgi:hypothetical protein
VGKLCMSAALDVVGRGLFERDLAGRVAHAAQERLAKLNQEAIGRALLEGFFAGLGPLALLVCLVVGCGVAPAEATQHSSQNASDGGAQLLPAMGFAGSNAQGRGRGFSGSTPPLTLLGVAGAAVDAGGNREPSGAAGSSGMGAAGSVGGAGAAGSSGTGAAGSVGGAGAAGSSGMGAAGSVGGAGAAGSSGTGAGSVGGAGAAGSSGTGAAGAPAPFPCTDFDPITTLPIPTGCDPNLPKPCGGIYVSTCSTSCPAVCSKGPLVSDLLCCTARPDLQPLCTCS